MLPPRIATTWDPLLSSGRSVSSPLIRFPLPPPSLGEGGGGISQKFPPPLSSSLSKIFFYNWGAQTNFLLAAAEADARVLVLRIEAELAVGALAFVVRVPGTACHQEHVRVVLARGRGPFPEVSVHVVHAVPAAALFLAAAALGGLGVGVALVLLVAVAVAVLGVVLAAAGGLPFVDGAEVLAGLFAEAPPPVPGFTMSRGVASASFGYS